MEIPLFISHKNGRISMGKQINFYLDEQTQSQFVDYLTECGFVLLNADADEVEPDSESFFSAYLYKNSYGGLIRTQNAMKQIDSIKSPVIQFNKTIIKMDQQTILRGRLWVEDKYYAENRSIVQKGNELVKDYQKLVRWIRKNVPYRKIPKGNSEVMEYASESLDELYNNGFSFTL